MLGRPTFRKGLGLISLSFVGGSVSESGHSGIVGMWGSGAETYSHSAVLLFLLPPEINDN